MCPVGVEVMEKQDRREQPCDGIGSSSAIRHAMVLNPSSVPCLTNRCDSLGNLLRGSSIFTHVHGVFSSVARAAIALVPDVVVLRLSIDGDTQELVASCRKTWNRAAILAVVCPGLNRRTERVSIVLNAVDDFLSCPFQDPELHFRLARILRTKTATVSSADRGQSKQNLRLTALVGESPSFLTVVEKISMLAACRMTVLISGETGTGKELFSRAIHYQSPRSGKPFVPVNCGALPDHLFENELFGHVRGAFTDASSAEKGLIAEAEGGTLFLDEIDTLSQAGQIKLLRFLQDGEYRPLGSARSLNADVRVIAATNADLLMQVERKQFREDLYYRLNSLSLSLPPLRDRIDDVMPLTGQFLNRYARENDQEIRTISPDALEKLMGYSWPGNVRELESVITRALTFASSPALRPEDFELPSRRGQGSSHGDSLQEAKNKTVAAFERRYLASLLAQHRGNVTNAAKAAGKERRSFQRLLRKHNLDRGSFLS
jgi:DNA-binding NtrC family response regulator